VATEVDPVKVTQRLLRIENPVLHSKQVEPSFEHTSQFGKPLHTLALPVVLVLVLLVVDPVADVAFETMLLVEKQVPFERRINPFPQLRQVNPSLEHKTQFVGQVDIAAVVKHEPLLSKIYPDVHIRQVKPSLEQLKQWSGQIP